MRQTALSLAIAAAVLATAARAQPVLPGQTQGLGLVGPGTPELLKQARANPYALSGSEDCATLTAQIAELDRVLGPDLDEPQPAAQKIDPMAAIRAILPYGGIVRLFTGAGNREKELTNAALAAWERRGFLKGTARQMGCPAIGQTAAAQVPPPTR